MRHGIFLAHLLDCNYMDDTRFSERNDIDMEEILTSNYRTVCPKCSSCTRHRSGNVKNYDCGSTMWCSEIKQSELCKARARIKELGEGLKPFAVVGKATNNFNHFKERDSLWGTMETKITVGDCRRAAKLLAKGK